VGRSLRTGHKDVAIQAKMATFRMGTSMRHLPLDVKHGMKDSSVQDKIDALIARFYSAFDNRGDATPRPEKLTDCFMERATIARRSSTGADLYTVVEFVTPRVELLTQGALLSFHEWEVSSATQIFGGIAARVSRYCKSGVLNGDEYSGSGTKCFHLIDVGIAWRIASLAWVDDNA
jgi:hypothetical protein